MAQFASSSMRFGDPIQARVPSQAPKFSNTAPKKSNTAKNSQVRKSTNFVNSSKKPEKVISQPEIIPTIPKKKAPKASISIKAHAQSV